MSASADQQQRASICGRTARRIPRRDWSVPRTRLLISSRSFIQAEFTSAAASAYKNHVSRPAHAISGMCTQWVSLIAVRVRRRRIVWRWIVIRRVIHRRRCVDRWHSDEHTATPAAVPATAIPAPASPVPAPSAVPTMAVPPAMPVGARSGCCGKPHGCGGDPETEQPSGEVRRGAHDDSPPVQRHRYRRQCWRVYGPGRYLWL
jgi:hypothetical protein